MLTDMEIWAEIRRRVLTGEISKRQACVEYEIHWQTLKKILAHEEPPGFRASAPRAKPKLGPFLPIIHRILEADRTAVREREATLTEADSARQTFQEQLRRRAEELAGRSKLLDEAGRKLADDRAELDRLRAELQTDQADQDA